MLRSIAFLVAAALGAVAFAAPGSPTKAKPTIAILAFDYGGRDPALEPLREGLSQMLISDVSTFPGVNVVERARLKALLEEQKLGRSGKVDPATAARVGKLLGARFLVLGNYFDLGPSVRIDARVVEVETGKVVRGVGVSGASADFLGIEQDLSGKLIDVIAGALPEPSKVDRPARAKPGKVKSTTVATYGRALLALDDGKKPEAKTLLKQVVSEAPEFQLAKAELNALLQ
jgi:TolB-like protein